MVIDVDARELYVFGGKYYTSSGQSQYSGLYSYSLRSRKWRLLSADAEPSGVTYPTSARIPSRIGHSMLFDPKHKRLLVLAGQRVDVFLSDVWAYDIQKGVWECLERDSSLAGGPEGGFTQRATMDVARREFVLLSGLMRDRSPPHLPNVKVRWQPCPLVDDASHRKQPQTRGLKSKPCRRRVCLSPAIACPAHRTP